MKNQKSRTYLFLTLLAVGALLGLILTFLATWADLEALHYAYDFRANTHLKGMSCPLLMTVNEKNSFSVKITNTTKTKLSYSIRTEISSRLLPIASTEIIRLEPGESKTMEWMIGPENIDLKHFIFSKIFTYGSYPIPNREATCGVFIVDLPTNGAVITWAMVVLSLLGMGSGLFGLNRIQSQAQRGSNAPRPTVFITISVMAGLIASFMGWWIAGILIIAITILFIVLTAGIALNRGGE